MKTAIVTGCLGQTGSYATELLLSKGYRVVGLARRKASGLSMDNLSAVKAHKNLVIEEGDITDPAMMDSLVAKYSPDELYHFAAMSFVAYSWGNPHSTFDINVGGTINVLESVRKHKPDCKVVLLASSEMFGKVKKIPQNEDTPFYPRSPYGISKCATYELGRNYRESYDMFVCNAICFNNESPRRGKEFVTRKITSYVGELVAGLRDDKLYLGNIKASRDWGYSKDYAEAIYLMLQQDAPDDFVIATGETHTVGKFLEYAFNRVGLDWQKYVVYNEEGLKRPSEVDYLRGDATKALKKLNWYPKTFFEDLVNIMVDADVERCKIIAATNTMTF